MANPSSIVFEPIILVAPYWNLNFSKSNDACVCLRY